MSQRKRRKGRITDLGLPIASGYLEPRKDGRAIRVGLLVGLLLITAALVAAWLGMPAALSGGPLSSAHAVAAQDCAACHDGFSRVADQACSTCHEKLGDDLGLYSYPAHYVYRSNDFQRIRPHEGELPCATCHREHNGRRASLVEVADARCLGCHAGHEFDSGHPEFAFARSPASDDAALRFAHGKHVRRVMERLGLEDLERACLGCHQPEPNGRGFQPIDFDRSCDACHLQAGEATPRLPLASGGGEIGVMSLEAIRSSGEPGTQWALFVDPNELRTSGQRVMKSPLHHRDPWILYNLRRLRRILYPNAGLADLLVTTPGSSARDVRAVYREAASTLETQLTGLRGSADPGIQAQLAAMESILDRIDKALEDPSTPLDEASLLLAFERPAELPVTERSAIEELVTELSTPCALCHRVENATIARVESDQKTLVRAEFDHRAHVIQRRCLDCHQQIKILDAVAGAELAPSEDNAGIHDLPHIEACRECHRPRLAETRCVQCHLFHPDKSRRASLLLSRQES